MNDDELIERLRSTLRAEADAVTPMHGTQRVTPRRRRHRSPQAAVLNRVVVVLASAAAVAAAVVVTFSISHGGSHGTATRTIVPPAASPTTVRTKVFAPAPTTPPVTAPPVPVSTTPPTPMTTAAPPTTLAPEPPADPVPTSFVARSVTFVSASAGWVLGTEPCATGTCLHLARTLDGVHWTDEAGPTGAGAIPAADTGRLEVRFADQDDGWIYELGTGSIWSTVDGGSSWAAGTLPGAIDALETSGGIVVAAVTEADGQVAVYSSSVHGSAFRSVAHIPAPAGGTTSTAAVVMQSDGGQDPVGWVLASNDRGVVGGVRLAGGTWGTWSTTPCTRKSGPALLAASDPTHLVAVCGPGTLAGSTTESVEVSSDGGTAFGPAAGGAPDDVTALATPGAGTIVGVSTADPDALVASIDAGAWQTVEPGTQSSAAIVQVGFEDTSQGVAIVETPSGGTLLKTVDGGRTWTPVSLQS